jgi:hypothetical protein
MVHPRTTVEDIEELSSLLPGTTRRWNRQPWFGRTRWWYGGQ